MSVQRFIMAIIPLLIIVNPVSAASSQNCASAQIEAGAKTAMTGIDCSGPNAARKGALSDNGTGRVLCLGLLACLFVAANQASRRRAAPVVLS